jgi:hypothetical protein
MKKTILVICLFSFTCYTYAQDPMFFESFVPSPATYAYGAGGYKLPSEGSLHILMIFAEFPDDSYDVSNSRWVKGQAPLNMNNWVDPSWSTSPTQGSLMTCLTTSLKLQVKKFILLLLIQEMST